MRQVAAARPAPGSGLHARHGRQALQEGKGGAGLGAGDSPGGTKSFGGSGSSVMGGTNTGGLGGTLIGGRSLVQTSML